MILVEFFLFFFFFIIYSGVTSLSGSDITFHLGDLARGTRDRAWSLAKRGREARGLSDMCNKTPTVKSVFAGENSLEIYISGL